MTETSNTRLKEIMPLLSKDQLRYIVARQEYQKKKDAAKAIGVKAGTVYSWPEYVDEAVDLMALDIAQGASALLVTSSVKAAMIKLAGLDSKDENVRQRVATEIIDRALGKAVQPLGGKDGGDIVIKVTMADE